jgi:hypothetical protein
MKRKEMEVKEGKWIESQRLKKSPAGVNEGKG